MSHTSPLREAGEDVRTPPHKTPRWGAEETAGDAEEQDESEDEVDEVWDEDGEDTTPEQRERMLREWVERAKVSRGMPSFTEWLDLGPIKVYVRWTKRAHPTKKFVNTMEIASVVVKRSANRRKGLFTELLTVWERLAKENGRWVYVESVMPKFLKASLERRGYASYDVHEKWNFWKECKD